MALLPRVLDAADRARPMTADERAAAVDAMAGDQLIFPMPH
jgi:hypothetical protein